MKKQNKLLISLVGAFGIVIVGALGYWGYYMTQPGKYDTFTQCLGERGAKFYGAFWCPHCQAQKALFGVSKSKLPYVECSTPDSKGQTEICITEEIKGYPTWKFADGSVTNGEMSLSDLAGKTGCTLPE
jgi:thiol-disulfide isomerase/thioredoxin